MEKQQPYCLMPWIHFHVGNGGKVNACCVANIPFGNINEQNFEEIWSGDAIEKLRNKFIKGEKDNRCAACYKLEAAGGKSIRQETFEKFPEVDIQNQKLPIYFDIRFSNVCNFRCRTCWHGASSKWFSDAKELEKNIGEKAIIQNVDDFNLFISQSGKALLQAEEIYFAGGEPLVTEEHYLLLNWLIEHQATGIRLRYNTNFSKLKFKHYDALKLWENFSSIEILASIDGVGALGEYIRKEMNWEIIKENRKKLATLSSIKFKIAPTISVFNIRHLPKLYQYCIDEKMIEPNDFYINILERPKHYNVKVLPPEYKTQVGEEYLNFFAHHQIPPAVKLMFQECLDYMNAEHFPKAWKQFQMETQLLDNLRDENLSQIISLPK